MCVCVMSLNCDVCLQCSEVDKVRDDPPKGTIMICPLSWSNDHHVLL